MESVYIISRHVNSKQPCIKRSVGSTLDRLMVLHVLGLTTVLLLGADTAHNQAALVRNLACECELSCKELGLTDTLLGDGQYGQTLLVRSCSHPLNYLRLSMPLAYMPLAQATCLYRATDLSPFVDKTLCLGEMIIFFAQLWVMMEFCDAGCCCGQRVCCEVVRQSASWRPQCLLS